MATVGSGHRRGEQRPREKRQEFSSIGLETDTWISRSCQTWMQAAVSGFPVTLCWSCFARVAEKRKIRTLAGRRTFSASLPLTLSPLKWQCRACTENHCRWHSSHPSASAAGLRNAILISAYFRPISTVQKPLKMCSGFGGLFSAEIDLTAALHCRVAFVGNERRISSR
ncbi:hypothetical protein ACLOJK_011869 [Asimina triloba]